MANYIPQGWQSSPQGKLLYSQKVAEIEVVVQRHVRKFRLQSMPPDDLAQEARLAAAYAVDTYNSGRGSLMGYVHHLVYNALAMVAAECLAQRRTPHIEVIEKVAQYDCGKITHINERWVKRPCMHVEMDNRVEESTSWDNRTGCAGSDTSIRFKALSPNEPTKATPSDTNNESAFKRLLNPVWPLVICERTAGWAVGAK